MHPAFKKLLEEQREIEAKKREEILISLGLYEEREERVYAEGIFSSRATRYTPAMGKSRWSMENLATIARKKSARPSN